MSDETIKWQDLDKEELFMMAKWHEARSSALFDVITHLTAESDPVNWELTMPDSKSVAGKGNP